MSDTIWAILIGVVMLAVLMVLVRPGSPAITAVNTTLDALTALVTTAVSGGNNG